MPSHGISRRFASGLMAAGLSVLLLATLAGCDKKPALVDVTDPNGLFHFKVDSGWQTTLIEGVNLVYADKKLPESGKLADTLALMVYPSYDATNVPLAEQLREVIKRRSTSRSWRSYSASEPTTVSVGGRTGVAIDVDGVDGNGDAFDARFFLVRTNEKQVGFLAVAPKGKLAQFDPALAEIIGSRWYWHRPADEATPSP